MIARFITGALIAGSLLLSGCATRVKMAFEDDKEAIKENSPPIYLMTATIKNLYKTSFQPKLIVVNLEKADAKTAEEKLNFTIDDKAKNESDKADTGNTYFLRMQLEHGKYELRGLTSIASSFPIHGFFFAPLHAPVESTASGVVYLGHITATVRERIGDEFRAGPPIPLIDQAVAGASGGTFDVEISDRFAEDEPIFRSKFPALRTIEIRKEILPKFDREKAQKWWAAN